MFDCSSKTIKNPTKIILYTNEKPFLRKIKQCSSENFLSHFFSAKKKKTKTNREIIFIKIYLTDEENSSFAYRLFPRVIMYLLFNLVGTAQVRQTQRAR